MDVALADWHAAGLRVASTVRLARLDCLEQSLLLHRLGALSAGDAQNLKNIWSVQVPVGTTESPCLSGVSFVPDGTSVYHMSYPAINRWAIFLRPYRD